MPQVATEMAVLRTEVEALRGEVAALSKETKALVDAWNTATGMVKFIKLLSTVLAAVGVIYFFFRHGFAKPPG